MHVAEQGREGQWGSVEGDPRESWTPQRALPVLGTPGKVLPGKSWVNYLTSLCLRFFICTGLQYPTSPATWPSLESLGARAGSWISPPLPTTPGGSDLGALTAQLGLDQGQLWRCAGCWWPEVVCSDTGANGCSCEVGAAGPGGAPSWAGPGRG